MNELEGITENDLMEILKAAHLSYIPEREGGWETVKEWKDVFSGGEKQRVFILRSYVRLVIIDVTPLWTLFRLGWRGCFTKNPNLPFWMSVCTSFSFPTRSLDPKQ